LIVVLLVYEGKYSIGVGDMATKSITKNIDIKDKTLGKSLVVALENAKGKKAKEVVYSKAYRELHGEEIRKIFGEK